MRKSLDNFLLRVYYTRTRRGVEQLAARRAHNPEAAGSSPAPAILLIPYVIRSYNTTKPNQVGLSVIQITNLSKQLK